MDFYWRVKNIPELRDVPARDRREWWREAVTRSRTTRNQVVTALVVMAVLTALTQFVQYEHWGFLKHALLGAVATAACALFLEYKIQQPRARQWLRAHLADERRRKTR